MKLLAFFGRINEAVDLGELEDSRMAMYYVSLAGDKVKKAMVSEPEYINPFLEQFTGDYQIGLEDLDDERRAQFEAWLETAISDQAHEAYTRVVHGIKTDNEHGGILLYRYIVAPSNLPETFHTQPVGIYWSSNPNDAKAHNSIEKEGWIEWLITAVTSPNSINWVATIFQNTIEPNEAEIQLTQGEPVTIIDLKPQTSPESAYGKEGMPGQGDVRYDFWDNREEPLQLSASIGERQDNNRLAHAKAMGFDTSRVWYHGTNRSFDAFSKDDVEAVFDNAQQELGYFFAGSPSYASRYTVGNDPQMTSYKGGNVIPVFLRAKKLKAEDIELIAEIEGDEMGGWSWEEVDEYKSDLIRQGYDGINFSNGYEIVIFDPKNIRSIHAQFNDANSDKLMAIFVQLIL